MANLLMSKYLLTLNLYIYFDLLLFGKTVLLFFCPISIINHLMQLNSDENILIYYHRKCFLSYTCIHLYTQVHVYGHVLYSHANKIL
jgi:hypothetical protein